MFLTTLGRTLTEGIKGFYRNNWLSVGTVGVLAMSLFIISILYIATFTADKNLKAIEDRVNISVYFDQDYSEDSILAIRDEFQRIIPEIKSVEYVSKDKALENFKRENSNEQVIIQSLEEIGENPLLSSLVIKANQQDQYQKIYNDINSSAYMENIFRINFEKNKDRIERLNNNILMIRRSGMAFSFVLAVIAILITFNTIRMTIYTQRKEIEVKRLVGASNFFIRLPFIFEGILYGLISAIVSVSVLFIFVKLKFLAPHIVSESSATEMVHLFYSRFLLLIGAEAGFGVVLGIVSSWIAMRKYLRI